MPLQFRKNGYISQFVFLEHLKTNLKTVIVIEVIVP